jgi:hypothetical protein
MWEKQDRDKSSTWRELKTVANNIQSLKNDLSGKFVKIYTDNKNVVSIVNKGSMKPDNSLHVELLSLSCFSHMKCTIVLSPTVKPPPAI